MKIICTTLFLFFAICLSSCEAENNDHANSPPSYPGSQTKVGPDSLSHPGNIDKDTIHLNH